MEEGVIVAESETDLVLIQVRIPDLKAEKCLQFSKEERVWDVKQQILAAMPKELEDSFNYGLFQPPLNGRAGKFLDEERRLAEYPFQASVGHLELKFKRRVYKMLNLDEKQLKSINSRANLKKFLEHVMANNVEKVNKMCNKGLDPNFHCQESGETPLSLISGIRSRPARMVMALVNGGAILDFRTKDGSTAMHRAVTTNNVETVRTMLELGASPNYRDSKNLTPLYHSVIQATDPMITETLLHDHAITGAQDLQGWQEVHQVCRSGMVQHLEHLLFYGADMNARNASGNTPLHVCAVNNQDGCARMLLFRGVDKECLNYAGQTAYQVAVIAGNLELAEVIQTHKHEDIVPFKDAPKYNPRRRVSGAPLSRTMSDCGSLQYSDSLRRVESPLTGSFILKPASPSLSDRSLPPFSSGSSISETSTGSGGTNSTSSREEEQLDSASTLAASIADQQSDVLSVSSGVGTSSNSGSGGSAATPTEREVILIPGVTVVSLENYNTRDPSHLKLSQGDVIEVTGSTDSGLMEGTLRGQTGYFPRNIVEEVRVRGETRVAGRREVRGHFGTLVPVRGKIALRIGAPRNCVLHKGKKGFGFVLRGAKAASPLMDMIPSDRCPSLQYMDDVDPGGVADMSGVNKGDFLLAINGEDVTQASHERVVTLIRQSGELVSLSVVTVTPELPGSSATLPTPHRQFSTLPRKPPGSGVRSPLQHPPPPPKRDPNTTLSVGRARAKSMVANMAAMDALDAAIKGNDMSGLGGVTSESQAQTNGVGPKVKNVAQELELIFKREAGLTAGVTRDKIESANCSPALSDKKKVYTSVAQMKRSRKGSVDLNNLHKDYHSTPDLQTTSETSKLNGGGRDQNIPDREEINRTEPRRIHSQEDLHLVHLENQSSDHPGYFTLPHKKSGGVQGEGEFRTVTRIRPIQPRSNSVGASYHSPSPSKEVSAGPAPLHPPPPPPPPPANTSSDYAKVGLSQEAPVSSFNPASNARLYESPKEVGNIGYKSTNKKANGSTESKKKSPTRTHSLPPRPTRPMVLKRIEDPASTETYSVNGVNYTTYTTFRSPITPEECPDSVSSKFFSEAGEESAETPTTPTNEGYREAEAGPHIPEPDYDMSDVDNQSYSGSESGSWRDTTATLRRNMRNTTERDRKKKKTVSFIMNEELANIIHSSGTMTKKDSILKDPSRERENGDDGKGRWRSTKRSPTKVSPPMPETPKTPSEPTFNSFLGDEGSPKSVNKGTSHPAWEGGSIVEPSNGQESPPKLVSNSKIRIEVGPSPGVSQSSTLPRSSHSLQKSHSFSADLSPGAQYRNNTKKQFQQPRLETAGIISQADLQKAKLHLKSSRSFPELLEDGDNSSSGVSSDQDQDSVNIPCEHKETEQTDKEFVTQLTVSNGAEKKRRQRAGESFECESNSSQSETDTQTSDKTWILRSEKKKDSTACNGGPTKHVTVATSTVQTKPVSNNNKNKKNVSITGANLEQVGPVHIEWSTAGEEHHYQNFASMMQQRNSLGDHVNVRRPFHSNDDVMSKSYHAGGEARQSRRQAGPDLMSQSLIQSDKSIEHSLALIRQHVKGLNDVQVYGGVPPPPTPSQPCQLPSVCPAPLPESVPLALAPPPGFSDSEHSLSDTDSLGSEPNNFQRFGFSRVSKPRSLAVRQDRIMPQAQYSGGVRKSASGVLEASAVQNYLSGSVQKEFRCKNLPDWSVGDVCDWLDSLFMPEYKAAFLQNSINGHRLAALDLEDWNILGIGKASHRLNIQKSIKRYMPKQ